MSATTKDHYELNAYIAQQLAATWAARRAEIEEIAAPVRAWLVDRLRPGAGDAVLELAAGTGDTGFDAAEHLGPEGRLLCTDHSPPMLDTARTRAVERSVDIADFAVVDAMDAAGLGDHAFDGVLCRFGYMLMPDAGVAMAETRRVLRPGGRLTLAVWGPPERNPFFAAVAIACVQRGHLAPPEPGGPGIFSLGQADRLAEMLGAAGFSDSEIEEVPVHFRFDDLDDYLAFAADTAGPIAMALRSLDDAERAAVGAQAGEALERFRDDAGYTVPGLALCAVAW